jgi:Na+/melibiose symporter-like transporter
MEERTLKQSVRWGYALGNNGFFITMALYIMYPLVFMTACLGLPFPLAIQILTWTKIFDLIFSFFSGSIIEKVKLPWGKYRSWFLVAPIIAGIATCLFFSPLLGMVPGAAVLPLGVFLMVLWNVASNIVLTCDSSMNNVLVQNPLERVGLFKLSNQCQAVTGAIAGFFIMKIVYGVGGSQTINLAGMQVVGIIYSVLYFLLYFNYFLRLKDYQNAGIGIVHKVSILTTLKLIFTNGKVAALTFSGMFGFSAETFFKSVGAFFFLYVLFSPQLLDAYNWTIVIGAFAGATLALPLARKTSKKVGYNIGYLIMAAGLVATYFTVKIPYLCLFCICVAIVGLNFARSLFLPMYSDVSDYTRRATGQFVTSYTMTAYNICFKVAGLVAAQASGLLASVGFMQGVDPTPEVSLGIARVATFGPAAFAVAGVLIMLIFYRLDEKKMPEIQAELKSRDAAQQAKYGL